MNNVDSSKIVNPELRFYLLVMDAFSRMPEDVDKEGLPAAEFYQQVFKNDGFEDLRDFLVCHDMCEDSWEFEESFFHAQNFKDNFAGKMCRAGLEPTEENFDAVWRAFTQNLPNAASLNQCMNDAIWEVLRELQKADDSFILRVVFSWVYGYAF